MNNRQKILLVVGFSALAIAVLAVAVPAVENSLPAAALVAAFGNDYVLAAGIALGILVAFVGVLSFQLRTGVIETLPPAVEGTELERPGKALDELLRSLSSVWVTPEHRQLHRQLRTITIDTVAAVTRDDDSAARQRIDDRSWTDDPVAAAFVSTERLDPPPISSRVRAKFTGGDWFRDRYRRTIDALESLEESE